MGSLSNWKIEYQGLTFEPPLDTGTVILISEYAGVEDWSVMTPLTSPRVLAAYLIVLVAKAMEVPADAVADRIMRMPIQELLDCCSVQED